MQTTLNATQPKFKTSVLLMNGSTIDLPVSTAAPLFVVGPNGAGKSGLMHSLYRTNIADAVRVSAHRQTWMESNSVPFSPQERTNAERNFRGEDNLITARWKEWNPSHRSGLVISDLIDAANALARKVQEAIVNGDIDAAQEIATELPPLDIISGLLMGSGVPIKLSIGDNSSILASKNGCEPYSIASLSDGERAALLMAGAVLTARAGALILIDEPERHLHSSIATPLLIQLFAQRPDCVFVISTHELSLPVNCSGAKTALVRESQAVNDEVNAWDIDILEPGIEIDDQTKEAILGARRKMLFIEGTASSLDKPLYELLFPSVTIFPRSSCRDVEQTVASVNDTAEVAWVRAWGIVDQDQLDATRKAELKAKGVFPLSVYSVEALYYHPTIIAKVAQRQCAVIGSNAEDMVSKAQADFLAQISAAADRLAARMSEQAVKDQIEHGMPDWKQIQTGHNVAISVDAQAIYQTERSQLQAWIAAKDIDKIVARYPIREGNALGAIVSALQFKGRPQFEAAVRKVVREDAATKAMLIAYFDGLPAAIA